MASTLARVESSNLPASVKSNIRRFYEGTIGRVPGGLTRVRAGANQGGHAMRQGGESLITGAALGAAHVYMTTGLDVGKVPVDGAIAAIGLVGSVMMAGESAAQDIGNVGAAAAAVYAFRKGAEVAAKKKGSSGGKIAGDFGSEDFGAEGDVDPVIAAARGFAP